MTTITRRLEWDSGHRVLGHGGKCRHLHGHRYVAEITVSAEKLDGLGFIVDFSVVKQLVGGWVDKWWDHNLLLNSDDPQAEYLCKTEERKPYLFGCCNPTAENITEVLCCQAVIMLPAPLQVNKVRVYETPNCWADYYNEGFREESGNPV